MRQHDFSLEERESLADAVATAGGKWAKGERRIFAAVGKSIGTKAVRLVENLRANLRLAEWRKMIKPLDDGE